MSDLKTLVDDSNYIQILDEFAVQQQFGACDACGGFGPYEYAPIINDILASQWKLNKLQQELMSARESMYCAFCGCSFRLRLLAKAIRLWRGTEALSLQELIESGQMDNIKVAEINSCGVLHGILKEISNLKYSEYQPSDPSVSHQDLQSLAYSKDSFDLVLTSDTLEHVPDPLRALKETFRVLKPGGAHIMSVPIIFTRKTRKRVNLSKNGKHKYLAQESFHGSGEPDYLVWNEFGYDFIELVKEAGFEARYCFINAANLEDPSGIIVASKPQQTKLGSDKKIIEFNKNASSNEKSILEKIKSLHTNFETIERPRNDIPNPSRQVKKVSELKDKIAQTEAHVRNIEEILASHNQYIEKINKDYKNLQEQLQNILSSKAWRVINKSKKIIKNSTRNSKTN